MGRGWRPLVGRGGLVLAHAARVSAGPGAQPSNSIRRLAYSTPRKVRPSSPLQPILSPVQGKENTGSDHLRKLVGQATSTAAGRSSRAFGSTGVAWVVTISSAIGLGGAACRSCLHISAPGARHSFSDDSREMVAESALTGEAPRSPEPLLRPVSNR